MSSCLSGVWRGWAALSVIFCCFQWILSSDTPSTELSLIPGTDWAILMSLSRLLVPFFPTLQQREECLLEQTDKTRRALCYKHWKKTRSSSGCLKALPASEPLCLVGHSGLLSTWTPRCHPKSTGISFIFATFTCRWLPLQCRREAK